MRVSPLEHTIDQPPTAPSAWSQDPVEWRVDEEGSAEHMTPRHLVGPPHQHWSVLPILLLQALCGVSCRRMPRTPQRHVVDGCLSSLQ